MIKRLAYMAFPCSSDDFNTFKAKFATLLGSIDHVLNIPKDQLEAICNIRGKLDKFSSGEQAVHHALATAIDPGQSRFAKHLPWNASAAISSVVSAYYCYATSPLKKYMNWAETAQDKLRKDDKLQGTSVLSSGTKDVHVLSKADVQYVSNILSKASSSRSLAYLTGEGEMAQMKQPYKCIQYSQRFAVLAARLLVRPSHCCCP